MMMAVVVVVTTMMMIEGIYQSASLHMSTLLHVNGIFSNGPLIHLLVDVVIHENEQLFPIWFDYLVWIY